ncbi:MAG: hypothetical protein ACT4UQ_04445, partial [Gammaproteobacteria bacterium]
GALERLRAARSTRTLGIAMRFAATVVSSMAVVAACAGPTSVSDLSQIDNLSAYYGVWDLTAGSKRCMPLSCQHHFGLEITETAFVVRRGQLRVSASYQAIPTADRLVFQLSDFQHNGEKDCEGYRADYIVRHFFSRWELALIDGKLKWYPEQYRGRALAWKRRMMPHNATP